MNHAETAAPAAEAAPSDLKSKTLLVISSPQPKKKFIYNRLKELGPKMILISSEANWVSKLADGFIEADPLDEVACAAKVEELVKSTKIDGVITFWENAVPLAATLAARFGWIGNAPKAALNARNKYLTRQMLENAKLSKFQPAWALIQSPADLEKAAARIGFPLVLKPAWGVKSQFVVKLDNLDEAKKAFEYIKTNMTPSFDPIYKYGTDIMVEGFMDGAEVDVDLLVQNGEIKFHAFTDNFPTKEPFFVETGDAMPSRHESKDLSDVLRMAKEVVAALGLTSGALHLEAKITPEGPKLIELNARMGGDYLYDWIKTVWEVDLIEESSKIAVGLPSQPKRLKEPRCHLVGKYLIPEHSGVVVGVKLPPEKPDAAKIHDIAVQKEAGDAVLVPPEGFETMGWIVGRGDTYAEAEENLDGAVRQVSVSIARFDSTSSLGKTRRKNRFGAAQVSRRRILQSARIERVRGVDLGKKQLHVGILCNIFDAEGGDEEGAVHSDLTSVGRNIQKAVESKGHRVTFFDMNETPLPFDKIANANVDLIFNVCERINNSSLLEPHAAAILDCLGIPYTGSNPLTLALCIDKIKVKNILMQNGLPTPAFDYVFQRDEPIREDLRFPLMVKLANTDNSIGISNQSVVTSPKALKEQVAHLLEKYRRPVLIEEFIEGDEVDVSIMGNEERVKVLPLSRSIFDDLPKGTWGIYPFQAKWEHNSVYEKIRVERPAKYSQKLSALISEICLDAYRILDCHDYARLEVRVDKAGNPYILEVNPNPSINDGDCVPACAEVIGQKYADFIEEIMKECILRYRSRPPYYHLQSAMAPF
ncbi:MAG: ATP-grasp domain-containing protein [Elusimicrobia bacterium]|nr:ATP-grasp domain-containing protein [Elusimicrobiota bacterium]